MKTTRLLTIIAAAALGAAALAAAQPVVKPIDKPPFDPRVATDPAEKAKAARQASQRRHDDLKNRWERGYAGEGKPTPPIVFDEPVKSIGSVSDDAKIDVVFGFRNASDQTVTIRSAKAACGCTVANLEKTVIGPGERGQIKAVYDPAGRFGLEFKDIDVQIDTPGAPNLKIGFLVETLPRVLAEPKAVMLSDVRRGASATRTITITGREPGFDVTAVTLSNPDAPFIVTRTGRVELADEHAAEGSHQNVTRITFDATLKPGLAVGSYGVSATFATSDPKRPTVTLPLSATVVGDLRAAPAQAFLLGQPGDSFYREVRVDHRNGSPFKVLGLYTEGLPEGFGLALDLRVAEAGDAPGEVRAFLVTIAGSLPMTGSAAGRIILLTDQADQPRIEIPVQAQVANVKR